MVTCNMHGQIFLPLGAERAQKEHWDIVVWDPVGQKTALPPAPSPADPRAVLGAQCCHPARHMQQIAWDPGSF